MDVKTVCIEQRTEGNGMTLGFVHEIVHEGKIIYCEDENVAPCKVHNVTFDLEKEDFKGQETKVQMVSVMALTKLRKESTSKP